MNNAEKKQLDYNFKLINNTIKEQLGINSSELKIYTNKQTES